MNTQDWTVEESWDALVRVRASNHYAKNTLDRYRAASRTMIKFTGAGIPVRSLTKDRMREYLQLRGTQLNGSSMNKTLQVLADWLQFCVDAGTGADPSMLKEWRRSPVQPTKHTFIDPVDMPRVLTHATDPRDRAIIACLWFTGLRSNEIVNLTVGDVDMERGMITASRSKVHDVKRVPMEHGLMTEMQRWFAHYNHPGNVAPTAAPRDEWALFPARRPRPDGGYPQLYPPQPFIQIRRIVRQVLTSAGYEGARLGAHTIRRSAGTALHDALVEHGDPDALNRTRIFLGHLVKTTTEGYLNRSGDDRIASETAAAGHLTIGDSLPEPVALAPVYSILDRKRIA